MAEPPTTPGVWGRVAQPYLDATKSTQQRLECTARGCVLPGRLIADLMPKGLSHSRDGVHAPELVCDGSFSRSTPIRIRRREQNFLACTGRCFF